MALFGHFFTDGPEFQFNPVVEIVFVVDAHNPYTQFRIHSEQIRQYALPWNYRHIIDLENQSSMSFLSMPSCAWLFAHDAWRRRLNGTSGIMHVDYQVSNFPECGQGVRLLKPPWSHFRVWYS